MRPRTDTHGICRGCFSLQKSKIWVRFFTVFLFTPPTAPRYLFDRPHGGCGPILLTKGQQVVTTGMNLRDALREASHLGCTVSCPNRTGEILVSSTNGKRVRVSSGRKDAPRALTTMLRKHQPKTKPEAEPRTQITDLVEQPPEAHETPHEAQRDADEAHGGHEPPQAVPQAQTPPSMPVVEIGSPAPTQTTGTANVAGSRPRRISGTGSSSGR